MVEGVTTSTPVGGIGYLKANLFLPIVFLEERITIMLDGFVCGKHPSYI